MRATAMLFCVVVTTAIHAEPPRVFPPGELPEDARLGELRNLNSYFPFQQVGIDQWPERQAEIKRRILISQGLWPMPTRVELNAVIHGRVQRDEYTVDRVFFESIPGHFVTGSLYRPKDKPGPLPAILSPHGHWRDGRFYDAGEAQIRNDLASGAERFAVGGRFPIQARAVQLARMGCIVFVYDMTGNADSIQIGHRPDQRSHLDNQTDWGFFSAQAELRLQNMMGLQTWNSIRAIDFLLELDDVDPDRIGVTGASGGGTQSMIISAIDERIAAAMPCVMVSTSMQGGCTCENAPYLRIRQGNIDIAAATAPRPLGLTAADDWTRELDTKGYPDLRELYDKLGHEDRLTAVFHTQFKHNYNLVNRTVMYEFFNRHLNLGLEEPIEERDYQPLTREEATVWTAEHPAPSDDAVGDAHETRIIRMATQDAEQIITRLANSAGRSGNYQRVVGGAWETILGRRLEQVGEVTLERVKEARRDGIQLMLGRLNHASAGEQLPVIGLQQAGPDEKGIVIWLTDQGKAGLFDGERIIEPVAKLVRGGFTVVSVDLFGQGEFVSEQQDFTKQPMWFQRDGKQGWHRFAGYTYGFNDPLFCKRVHDVLTMIKFAETREKVIHLVGLGEHAGAIAIAARSQAGDSVARTFVDTQDFRFQSLREQDDPMFVPGSVRYLDINGLVTLCLPGQVDLVGEEVELVKRRAKSAGTQAAVSWHASKEDLLKTIAASLR